MLLCADVHLYDIGPKPLVICVDIADIVSSDENALRNRKRTFIFPLGFALGKRPTHTEEQKFIFVRFQNQDRTNQGHNICIGCA